MTLGYAKVRVNITALVVDGIDSDDLPDDQPLTAVLTLSPMVQQGKMLQYNDNGVMKLKALTAMTVNIGGSGDIDHRSRDYVKVVAPTAVESNMSELQWMASFTDIKYGELKVAKIDPIYFYAHPDEEINLADKINVAPISTAVLITRGARGFGVIGAEVTQSGELVITYESALGPVDSDPITLPAPGIADGSVTQQKLAAAVVQAINAAYVRPSNGIPTGDLSGTVRDALAAAATAYQRPEGGVPKTDLASAVRTSLTRADDAVPKALADISYAPTADNSGFDIGSGSRRLAAALQRAYVGLGTCDIAIVGDSVSTAYTGAGFDFPGAWWRRLKATLVADGYADGGSGWVPCLQGDPTAIDPRWSLSGGWDLSNYAYILASSNGATATFTSTTAGTSIELLYGNTGNPFTVSIDGAAPVTVTPTGNPIIKSYIVTGLSNSVHTVQIVGQQFAAIVGILLRAATGIRFHPVGKYGMTAQAFADNVSLLRDTALAAAPTPDAVIIQVGANDISVGGQTPTATVDKIRSIRQLWPNADAILAVEPQTTAEVSASVWTDFQTRLRALAVELSCPIVDLHRRWGGSTSAAALGFIGPDNKHPNAFGQRDIAAAYLRSLRQVYNPPTAFAPQSGAGSPDAALTTATGRAAAFAIVLG